MKLRTGELTKCGMFAALITIGAFIRIEIPLPMYTMHFTLQWLFVLISAMVLGRRLSTISVLTYLCMGLLGLPVFAAGGGPAYVLRPGFGFLLGFLAAAFFMGGLVDRIGAKSFFSYFWISVTGLIIYYGIGAVYFFMIKNLYAGEEVSMAVVIVQYCLITVFPDFVLCLLADGFCVSFAGRIRRLGTEG